MVDDDYYDNPTGDYIFGPLDLGPLSPGQAYERVLDFGCGPGRDARRLLLQRRPPKSYVGVDINRPMIQWCQENLARDGFSFVHHDVWSPTYGTENSKNRYLPLTPVGSDFTLIHANSVFTHLHEDQAEFYLREMRSMLAPTGIIHATWFFFNKKWFPMMAEQQNTLLVNEHDTTQAVYYDWYYFRNLAKSLGLRIAEVKWTKVLGFHNIVILAKDDRFPDFGDKAIPPSSVVGFQRSGPSYKPLEHEHPAPESAAPGAGAYSQLLATDLQAAHAELERLLAEQSFQAERITSLTGERDHWASRYAAINSTSDQTFRTLTARLEEIAAEKESVREKYERSQAERTLELEKYERSQAERALELQKLAVRNRAMEVRLEASEARLRASTATKNALEDRLRSVSAENRELEGKLEASLSRLNGILGSRAWKALSPYRKSKNLLSYLRPRLLRDQRLIRASGLFDESWYLSQYPDVQVAGVDPLIHYLQTGAIEGRDPNPYFDSDWYLKNNPDVATARINPLRHYLHHGAAEQRDPSPAFNTKDYLRKHPEVAASRENPLSHFLRSRKSIV